MRFLLKNRDFSDMAVQPDLEFSIERYSWMAQGGPKMATITARGSAAALWSLLNHLRAPVEIYDDRGNLVWWGYLATIETDTKIGFGADISAMYNRVAVAYTDQSIRYTTDWSEDAELTGEYGKKEILLSASDMNETAALMFRDTFLAAKKRVIPTMSLSGSGDEKATITCLGWFYTLDWQYFQETTGKESYEVSGQGGREIGEDDRPIMAQSFQIAATSAWPATSIWLRPWKQGSSMPTDNLLVSIKSDNGGEPGTTLASSQLGAADIGTQAEWLEFALNTGVTLQPATTYWIHIARSGAVAASNYFMVDTNVEAGYPRGILRLWNTNVNAWTTEPENWQGDLLFKVVGTTETTDQIESIITRCGQFFGGSIIETASGSESNPYRDGDTTGLFELKKILDGGTSNYRRMLCEVTQNRYLRVYEEPVQPANPLESYGLTKEKHLVTQYGTPVDMVGCPVAIWCHLVDVIPPTVDLSLVADPSLFFIEEAEVDVITGEYNILLTRDQVSAFDTGAVYG